MDCYQLRVFREVARHRSFSGAAKALFISQPAVSRQIASLEADVGMSLFIRMGNNISLTDPGRKLLAHAEEIMQKLDQATRTLQDLKDLRKGVVNVAADAYLSKYFLPRFAGEFHRRHPGIQLRFTTAPQTKLSDLLSEGQADVAFFCGELEGQILLTQERLYEERLMFVAQKLIEADIEENISLSGPFLFPPDLNSFGEDYRSVLPKHLVREDSSIIFDSLEGIKSSLLTGFGCSIMPENLVKFEVEHGYLRAIPINISCPVVLTYPKHNRLAHPVLLFLSIVRKLLNTALINLMHAGNE